MAGLLLAAHRNRYSLERLKFLYSDLLQAIDISDEDLGRRGEVDKDYDDDDDDDDDNRGSDNDGTTSSRDNSSNTATNASSTDDDASTAPSNPASATSTSTDNLIDLLRQSLTTILPRMHRHQRRRTRRRRFSPIKRRARRIDADELQEAFRFLAATRSPDNSSNSTNIAEFELHDGGAAAFRDDELVSALHAARYIEKTVAKMIRQLGEVVVHHHGGGETTTKEGTIIGTYCDPCFEYFCEKNILHLLVDIAKENGKLHHKTTNETTTTTTTTTTVAAHQGVVWSISVKAQVLQTVSALVAAGARKQQFLYYILSQNSINELLSCMLPLTQWTDPALEQMMPALVDLLKNLGLQLAGSPELFPFFANQHSFPLLHVALEIGTSAYAQSNSFVHITCLSIIINTMKIDTEPIHAWVSTAVPEMQTLCGHLSQLLLNNYHRIADLASGPIVDGFRNIAIGSQLVALQDQISVLNDVLSCGIPGLDVRLCEELFRRVILVVLRNLEPPPERNFLHVGVSDLDVIPHRECLAQGSMIFLAQLFQYVEYLPFVRMLAVALFHPKSASTLVNYHPQQQQQQSVSNEGSKGSASEKYRKHGDYLFVPALDAIAQGKLLKDAEILDNPFRKAFLRTLRGDFGDWRFPAAAIVLETVLSSKDFDLDTLQILNIVPHIDAQIKDGTDQSNETDKEEKTADETKEPDAPVYYYKPTDFEGSLATFLKVRSSSLLTSVLRTCLECAGSLSLALYYRCTMNVIKKRYHCRRLTAIQFPGTSDQTPLHTAMLNAKTSFCERAIDCQTRMGVSDIFLELVETAVVDRYKKVAPSGIMSPPSSTYACHLSQIGCAPLASSPDLMVRRSRCIKFTDVEEARFRVEMAIHFRALCNVIERFGEKSGMATSDGEDLSNVDMHVNGNGSNQIESMALDLVDVADEFAIAFGGLEDKPDVTAELDFRGRMTFPCVLSTCVASEMSILNLAEDAILRHAASLVLVVDPTDMFVAKPNPKSGVERGTIVCRISLQSVIAAAPDGERLHVAVRHSDVGRLIKNGNMVLQFENAATCVVVAQYLRRCRQNLRHDLNERFRVFMDSADAVQQTADAGQFEDGDDDLTSVDAEKVKMSVEAPLPVVEETEAATC